MLVAGTPETTNPVSGQCEANGVPCVSTVAPWQPWFLGQQKDPANPVPFKFAYHFFWGLEDIEQVFLDMWNTINTNKKVAGFFPNDGAGNAWGDPNLGIRASRTERVRDRRSGPLRGRHAGLQRADSAQKKANAQILTGVPIPPDFTNFWKQANQQGFVPHRVRGQGLLFPTSSRPWAYRRGDVHRVLVGTDPPVHLVAHGSDCDAARRRVYDVDEQGCTQPIGFAHALIEVATDVLQRTTDLTPDAIVAAIVATNLNTIVGQIQWTGSRSRTSPNAARRRTIEEGSDFPYELVV